MNDMDDDLGRFGIKGWFLVVGTMEDELEGSRGLNWADNDDLTIYVHCIVTEE